MSPDWAISISLADQACHPTNTINHGELPESNSPGVATKGIWRFLHGGFNRATPRHHPNFSGIFPEIKQPANLGYPPWRHGNPHISSHGKPETTIPWFVPLQQPDATGDGASTVSGSPSPCQLGELHGSGSIKVTPTYAVGDHNPIVFPSGKFTRNMGNLYGE